jgi:hypothetical protein
MASPLAAGFGGALAGLGSSLQAILSRRDQQQARQDQLRQQEITNQRLADQDRRLAEGQEFNQALSLTSNLGGQDMPPATAASFEANPMTAPFVTRGQTLPGSAFTPGADGMPTQTPLEVGPNGRTTFTETASDAYRRALINNDARFNLEKFKAQQRRQQADMMIKSRLQIANITDARERMRIEQQASQFAERISQAYATLDERQWNDQLDYAASVFATQVRQSQGDSTGNALATILGSLGSNDNITRPVTPQTPPAQMPGGVPGFTPAPSAPISSPTVPPPPSRGTIRPPQGSSGVDPRDRLGLGIRPPR